MARWWLLLLFLGVWMGAGLALIDGPAAGVPATGEAEAPLRIVCLAPSVTEIVCALGLADALVGVSQFSDYPPSVMGKARVGSFWQPDIEAVIALRPDLVVALDFPQQRDVAGRLNRVGFRTICVRDEYVKELFEAIEYIGAATARTAQAAALAADMKRKLAQIRGPQAADPRPRVLWVVQREPLRVAGRDTFVNELIELAGGVNAIGPTVQKYPPVGAEQVVGRQVDVIIEPAMGAGDLDGQQRTAEAFWGRYGAVPAVQNKRVYVICGDSVSRLGPRLCEGVSLVARCLGTD